MGRPRFSNQAQSSSDGRTRRASRRMLSVKVRSRSRVSVTSSSGSMVPINRYISPTPAKRCGSFPNGAMCPVPPYHRPNGAALYPVNTSSPSRNSPVASCFLLFFRSGTTYPISRSSLSDSSRHASASGRASAIADTRAGTRRRHRPRSGASAGTSSKSSTNAVV